MMIALKIAVIIAVGAVNYFLIGLKINDFLFHAQTDYFKSGKLGAYKLLHFIVRPAVMALVFLGIGALIMLVLKVPVLISILAFVFFFILSTKTLIGAHFLDSSRTGEYASMTITALVIVFLFYFL
jgi:hypothetical protein